MAPPRGSINPRTIMAPVAAFTMACVLFAYTRSSITSAKMNAQKQREEARGRGSGSSEER